MRSFQRRRLVPIASLALGSLLGCELSSDPVVCTTEARPSVAVLVRDSVSGLPIAFGATLILRDGAFVDSISGLQSDSLGNALPLITPQSLERPGNYQVTVRRPNYADWVQTGVVVTRGVCHVQTVTLTARLQPIV